MAKKFFVLFFVACFMLCATAANAGSKTIASDNSGSSFTYTNIKYTLEGEEPYQLYESDAMAGRNYEAVYLLPSELTLDAEFNLSIKDPTLNGHVDIVNPYSFTTDDPSQITYKWKVNGLKIGNRTIDSLKYAFDKNASGDILIISGVLPEDTNAESISVDLVANITQINITEEFFDDLNDLDDDEVVEGLLADLNSEISNVIAADAKGDLMPGDGFELDFSKNDDEPGTTYIKIDDNENFSKFANPAGIDTASDTYFVTVSVPFETHQIGSRTTTTYTYYFAKDDEDENKPAIELPSWLKLGDNVQTREANDEKYITSFEIVANKDSYAIKGAKGRVRVRLAQGDGDDRGDELETFLQWDVTCDMESSIVPSNPSEGGGDDNQGGDDNSPFSVNGGKEVKFDLHQLGESKSETITYTGATSVTYNATGLIKSLIDKKFFDVDTSTSGSIVLTATAPTSMNTEYIGDLEFQDGQGNRSVIKVTVEVSDGSTKLLLNSDKRNVPVSAGGSNKVTIAATGTGLGLAVAAGTITWSVKKNEESAALDIEPSEPRSGSDNRYSSITYEISAPANMKAGDYHFTVRADYGIDANENDLYQETDITVTVTNNSGGGGGGTDNPQPSTDFDISASSQKLTVVKGENPKTVNIRVTGTPNGNLTWSEDHGNRSGLSISFTRRTNTIATVSIAAANSLSSTTDFGVRIFAVDENGISRSVPLNVTASVKDSSGTGEDNNNNNNDDEKYVRWVSNNADKIKNALNNVPRGVGVAALDSKAILKGDEVDAEELEALSADLVELVPPEVPVKSLSAIDGYEISEAQVYVYRIDYDVFRKAIREKLLLVGEKFFVHMIVGDESATDEDYGTFIDNDGKEITTVPEDDTNGINVAAYLEPDITYWPVISKYMLTTVSTDNTNLTLEAGKRTTVKFTANKIVDKWEVSADKNIFSTRISKEDDIANISFMAADTKSKDHEAIVIAQDVDGTQAELKIKIAIKPASEDYSLKLSASPASLRLTAGGGSENVTVTASGKFKNNLSWKVKDNGGLTVEETGTPSNTRHQYKISAPSTMTGSAHSIVIEVSDGDTNVETVEIRVVVATTNNGGNDTPGNNNNDNNNNNNNNNPNGGNGGGFTNNGVNVNSTSIVAVSNSLLTSPTFADTLRNRFSSSVSDVTPTLISGGDFSNSYAAINEVNLGDQTTLLTLPTLESDQVTETKIYVFAIDNFYEKISQAMSIADNAGKSVSISRIFVKVIGFPAGTANVESLSDAEAYLSASEENNEKRISITDGILFDDRGVELTNLQLADVTRVALNGSNINVAALLKPGNDYTFVITASDTDNNLGPSGAGCYSGSALGIIAMAMTSWLSKVRKKNKKVAN